MDVPVPRNKTAKRVYRRRPYRPRGLYPEKPVQTMIKTLAALRHNENERNIQEAADRRAKELAQGKPGDPILEKKTRRNYKAICKDINGKRGRRPITTVRELVNLMPTDHGSMIAFNPLRDTIRVLPKKDDPMMNVETVAKPRYSTPTNTLVLTIKYHTQPDLDRLLRKYSK
ncbi:unnamed protein product [Caenorhabditis nigoni]